MIERHIDPKELDGFSECFLTGSAAELTPVGEIGAHRFTPGQITETLTRDYSDDVNRPVSSVTI